MGIVHQTPDHIPQFDIFNVDGFLTVFFNHLRDFLVDVRDWLNAENALVVSSRERLHENFVERSNERRELVAVETAPLEESHRTLVDEIHSTGINGDVSRAERSDGCGRSIKSDEMHIDLAVVFESSGYRQAGGEGTAEAVDKHIHLLALVFGKILVNLWAVEVIASDVAFKRYVVSYIRHGVLRITPRSYRALKAVEMTEKDRKNSYLCR